MRHMVRMISSTADAMVVDVTGHHEAITDARRNLSEALADLAALAKTASKASGTKTGNPDLPAVYAAARAVERAEEAVDLAKMDLEGAIGHDL